MSDESAKPAERRARGEVNQQFISEKQGKRVISFHGLLDVAHQEGMSYSHVELIQIPHPDNGNTAICLATVKTNMGSFTDVGDANASNVSKMIFPHIIRMSATRALARALRQATNVGMLCDDEFEEEKPKQATRPPAQPQQRPSVQQPRPQPAAPAQDDKPIPATIAGCLKLVVDLARAAGKEYTREEANTYLDTRIQKAYNHPITSATRQEVEDMHKMLTDERRKQPRPAIPAGPPSN